MKIAVVGAGRAATALAVLWDRAGHEIVAACGRSSATRARVRAFLPAATEYLESPAGTAQLGDLVVLGVPDDAIAEVCSAIAGGLTDEQVVVHLSGSRELDVLSSAAEAGASILSLHPLQTLPTVETALERIPGSAIAVTAADEERFELGERLAVDTGAQAFRLPDPVKGLYHAAAVFASNYMVAVTAEAEALFKAAGLPEPSELFMPLVRASIDNVASLGPEAALTGPAARGDAGTVARNLEALGASAPDAIGSYIALADVALDLAEHSGRLDAAGRAGVDEVLARWR